MQVNGASQLTPCSFQQSKLALDNDGTDSFPPFQGVHGALDNGALVMAVAEGGVPALLLAAYTSPICLNCFKLLTACVYRQT